MDTEFVLESGKKFISNVLGATGAIWGSSEIVRLRTNNNRKLWRGISVGVGILFFYGFLRERREEYFKKFEN